MEELNADNDIEEEDEDDNDSKDEEEEEDDDVADNIDECVAGSVKLDDEDDDAASADGRDVSGASLSLL